MSLRQIQLRGVAVHNLRQVDLDLPHHQLIVFCGPSGSGKTSLALDTLYAEGQRRYIESFSAYTRQFLERLEKPAAERIDGIPAAIAVTRQNASRSNRTTIGSVTEVVDYLRLMMAKIGVTTCPDCQVVVRSDSPESVATYLETNHDSARLMLAYRVAVDHADEWGSVAARLQADGFLRFVSDGQLQSIEQLTSDIASLEIDVLVDRIRVDAQQGTRLRESLEACFELGSGDCVVYLPDELPWGQQGVTRQIDEVAWRRLTYSRELTCHSCQRTFPKIEPRLFSYNSPLGACEECEGFGNILDVDLELVVPDPTKSLEDGAIAPWNTPAYAHEREELLALAPDYDLPTKVPFRDLTERHLQLIQHGVAERNFGGLDGFFAWLERRKYKMHIRVFLSRWRSYRLCPACQGARLRPAGLNTRVGGKQIAELCELQIGELLSFFQELELSPRDNQVARLILDQVRNRLKFLVDVGLGYLALDRTLRTLSGGEAQRVALTTALGSTLVNMLYVLDEPSVGLHPRDVSQLVAAVRGLRDRGNTVVVVEHEDAFLRAADQLVEIGPGAGNQGGRIVFQGTLDEMIADSSSLTGQFLAGKRGISSGPRRQPNHGWICLRGAEGNNLNKITVEFPLGVLCVVTGVSGAGKSTLVHDTLYGALCRRKRKEGPKPFPYEDVYGDGQLDEVVLVDQSPIGRSPRSNPVTYIKAFDPIRSVFAQTIEARTHNYTAGHFSFNVEGGRCETCHGDGFLQIDMQFLADVFMKCSQCGGTRYRDEILDVTYRGHNIAEVMQMTVREAFSFFRGQVKVQAKLKRLLDVGLDYLRLGQPANTLSTGEAQRLKLAAHLSSNSRNRILFILDEPTTGLHYGDIVQLLDCFDSLISVGHSLIVVEHNLQVMRAADHIIDLGPGPAQLGGNVVATGTPEEVALYEDSYTGHCLAEELRRARAWQEDCDR